MVLKKGDRGSLVSLLQLGLERAGYNVGQKDGIFGSRTEEALRSFQRDHQIAVDGIAGVETMGKIRQYISGYTTYTVKSGDTLYSIARRLYSSIPLIENANPKITPNNLSVGSRLIVPYNFSVVPTDIAYSSLLTELVLEGLAVRYPFIELSSVGQSVMKRQVLALKMGKGENKVFVNASHHANEWITTPLALKFVEEYAAGVVNAGFIGGQSAEYMFSGSTLYVVPLVNPDGVDLVTNALDKNTSFYKNAVQISENYPSIPFPSGWKANIEGTDLNLNYPADWPRARELKFAQGFTSPAPRDFVGEAPLSAEESRNMYNLTLAERFDITLSLHTQGEEIYWQFKDYATSSARALGEKLAAVSGYALTAPLEISSYAGYKDWFLQSFRRPGYTIEAGRGTNPLPISDFSSIYPDIRAIISATLIWEDNNEN
jgi:g-D-glutamyl-meso-diaminopimelate peptidase